MLRRALTVGHAVKGSLEGQGAASKLLILPHIPTVFIIFVKPKEGGRSLLLPDDFGRKQSLSTGHPLLFILLSLPRHTD